MIASGCAQDGRHHQNLTVLDLGFNSVGDAGCTALSLHMVAGNHTLRNLFLSGNHIERKGAMALASAILHGCSLSRLNLSANNLGADGINVIAQSIREAESRVQQLLQRQGGIKLGYNIKPVTIEELNVDNVSMLSKGFEALSLMVLTNFNLKNISLANNDLHDSDLALLSQSLTQNKEIPIKSLVLSFNKITCVGVECLMNAVWGSQTLKEIKLDNNKMQDRGAQLCSVVLGSIRLEVLDVSCNRISTVGVKAIMKSLSDNDSLKRLALCGIPMDQNASKAVSYALAYNQSLQRLNIDSCSVGYSGQRHIVAGIVSNQYTRLQVLTGFPLARKFIYISTFFDYSDNILFFNYLNSHLFPSPNLLLFLFPTAIIMTLGLPQLPEDWGNDRVLSFVRFMWSHWKLTKTVEPSKEVDKAKDLSRGPAPPSMVASSAKRAFGSLSKSEEARIAFQNELQNQIDDNPIIAPDTSILVRSQSGNNLQVPTWEEQQLKEVAATAEADYEQLERAESWTSSEMESIDRSSYTGSSVSLYNQNTTAIDFERRNRNLSWLRSHLQTLTEVGNLAFDDADLWQLHQYYMSPAYNADDEAEDHVEEETEEDEQTDSMKAPPPTPAPSESEKPSIGRAISFRTLGKAIEDAAVQVKRPNKRSSFEEELKPDKERGVKRAKNSTPRIAYYPRVKEQLEAKPSAPTLALLRQLKYIESVMLEGKNIYTLIDQEDDNFPNTTDVEMVLLDLL
ncbi:MAG: Ran GTPase-activating protein (RanGAP) involved in mRNA processing and transport [Bacillariaceae sp.]|jgi:Ran GTPase-activating protein (RanGAP) involved in mRNA processing and transport